MCGAVTLIAVVPLVFFAPVLVAKAFMRDFVATWMVADSWWLVWHFFHIPLLSI